MRDEAATPNDIPETGSVRFLDRHAMRAFDRPTRIIVAHTLDEVLPAMDAVERETESGNFAAGFVAYEAAPAFDPALSTHPPGPLPLVWFAIYSEQGRESRSSESASSEILQWNSTSTAEEYRSAIDRIRSLIAAGDTYQVNFTYPMHANFEGSPWQLFNSMAAVQPTDFGAYVDTGRYVVLSVSPEMFFRLDGDSILCRPMKGTAPRGLWCADDETRSRALRESAKERAENVMITDMTRNDLGRIAGVGSVRATSLFDAEPHPTVWQMTSTVQANTHAGLSDLFRALFPAASVTGAPKVRTMQIIRELEAHPRGVYCGAIGWVGPGRRAEFSVGIRTATVDRECGRATYSVGSGITWDSVPNAELEECRLKAAVLVHRRPHFDLLESLRWDGEYWFLDSHIDRLRASARFFDFVFDDVEIRASLDRFASALNAPSKVRITLSRSGAIEVGATPIGPESSWRVEMSPVPVDSTDVFLYHKTTQRAMYERSLALCPGADDVILWNEKGEITESTRANIAVRIAEIWYTPPVACGLLQGVMRTKLLAERRLYERVLTPQDLDAADEVQLINSVRGWIPISRVRESGRLTGRVLVR